MMDLFTYLRGLGYYGTTSQMALQYRKDTTRWKDTYVEQAMPTLTLSVTYDGDSNVSTIYENGIKITYTYNANGDISTENRDGVTYVYVYDGSNRLVGVSAV